MTTLPSATDTKGRASAARPFVSFLFVALVVLVAVPAFAQAIPRPLLEETNPASPGASLTPRVKGQLEEGETKAIHFAFGLGGPVTRGGVEPTNTVRVYTDSSCSGSIKGEGTVAELEAEGIEVIVASESVTTFYAAQSNEGGSTSACSTGLVYRHVASAPGAPSFESVSPPSPANNNFPHLVGSADPDATVSIYTTSDCTGAPLAGATGAAFAVAGISVSVPDNSETTFHAKATMAGFSSLCSTGSIAYREVTPPSEPTGGGGGAPTVGGGTTAPPPQGARPVAPHAHTSPDGTANDNTPAILGSAPGATSVKVFASTDCSGAVIAKGPASQFSAPGFAVQVPDNVTAVFSAVSVAAGAESACSAPVVYIEDSTAPHTKFTMGPAAKTARSKAVFRFTDTTGAAPGTIFLCRVDKGKWKKCSSPFSLRHLRPRRYLVQVKAVDPAGNAELKPAKRPFKVIRQP
jgi:hypothetical protein